MNNVFDTTCLLWDALGMDPRWGGFVTSAAATSPPHEDEDGWASRPYAFEVDELCDLPPARYECECGASGPAADWQEHDCYVRRGDAHEARRLEELHE